ncbi:MAG: sulfotransferase [Actinomycetota bacterium]|nr:sulfotransferase [Actinomycetota bacterium]
MSKSLRPAPILVIGPPRSATTWVGNVLSAAPGAVSVHEPDNETQIPFAVKAKWGLGRFPVLGPSDDAPPDYERLWSAAFEASTYRKTPNWYLAKLILKRTGTPQQRAAYCAGSDPHFSTGLKTVRALAPTPGPARPELRPVVKTVNAILSLEWILKRWDPKVVAVLRHPFEVVASWRELGWRDCNLDKDERVLKRHVAHLDASQPGPDWSPLQRVAWQVGLLFSVLMDMAEREGGFMLASHEELCIDPRLQFRSLYQALDLDWSEDVDAVIDASNRPGTGTTAARIASQQVGRWRKRLQPDEVQQIRAVLEPFELSSLGTDWD